MTDNVDASLKRLSKAVESLIQRNGVLKAAYEMEKERNKVLRHENKMLRERNAALKSEIEDSQP